MQTILNNPLAEPVTLGIAAAASFGAATSIVLGVSVLSVGGLFLTAAATSSGCSTSSPTWPSSGG
jgi:iron complex transport system permease protein